MPSLSTPVMWSKTPQFNSSLKRKPLLFSHSSPHFFLRELSLWLYSFRGTICSTTHIEKFSIESKVASQLVPLSLTMSE
ncbi:hypothetical protein H5410_055813 [Solanum commersonii]|uniref:Uncharacterized protein n=1 Tax=Solanum commersonii TaxID=4109 RepID=A0A9J5WK91_SOLCO|nr:hypothetical protein H5410_055813 [Solanum commersonii]